MTKTAGRPITVSDDKHKDGIDLRVGDPIPEWALPYIKEEYVQEDHPVAAGLDLFEDHTYPEMCRAAERIGVEVEDGWSSEQIAAMIRHRLFDDEAEAVAEAFDEEKPPSSADAMAKLFAASNESGNVNAPDVKTKDESKSKPKASSGGANS